MINTKLKNNTMVYKELAKNMVIVYDTREKEGKNSHILEYLTGKGVPCIRQKMDYGDYTCIIPKNEKMGLMQDIYCGDIVTIERKANLEELSNNLCHERERIERELQRHRGNMYMLIEGHSYEDLVKHNYGTKMTPQAFIGSLYSFATRYGVEINYIKDKRYTGHYIAYILYYNVVNAFKYGILSIEKGGLNI